MRPFFVAYVGKNLYTHEKCISSFNLEYTRKKPGIDSVINFNRISGKTKGFQWRRGLERVFITSVFYDESVNGGSRVLRS